MADPRYPYKDWLPAPIYWPYRAIRTLGVAFCFFAFWTTAVLLGWLWLPVLLLWPGSRETKIRRVLRSVRRGFMAFHFTMRVLRLYHRQSPFKTLRPGGTPADKPVVLIANHPTLCDTTSITSLFPNIVAVASPAYANHRLMRRLVRACGFIGIGVHMMQECQERLAMGFDVLVFPEGTRSPPGGLQPFHRGAFELAARAKVPIVLVKLVCEPLVLTKRLPIWKIADKTAILSIEAFDVIDPASMPSRTLCRVVEQRYRELLGYAPAPEQFSDRSRTA